MREDSEKLKTAIYNAQKLHGHLGPFLVIGVRMGKLAETNLNINVTENSKLEVSAKVPLVTPFSCILDGIQTTTQCTVGNQRLKMENSQKEIAADFKLPDNTMTVSVNQQVVDELMSKISEGASNEELAWEIASMSENRLFTVGKR